MKHFSFCSLSDLGLILFLTCLITTLIGCWNLLRKKMLWRRHPIMPCPWDWGVNVSFNCLCFSVQTLACAAENEEQLSQMYSLLWCHRMKKFFFFKYIFKNIYLEIVKQLQITAPDSGHCCHWLWTPNYRAEPLMCHWSSGPHTPAQKFPTRFVCCESTVGCQQAELQDQEAIKAASYAPSSTSSTPSLSEHETSKTFHPGMKDRRVKHRPTWRYWRRTGAEPQHKQPGGNIIGAWGIFGFDAIKLASAHHH